MNSIPIPTTKYALRVWVLKHRDDQEYFNKCKFSDLMHGFAAYCDLHYPIDNEDPANWYWGSFYLNPEEHQAGYYDFVRQGHCRPSNPFYHEEELVSKSGTELETLMHKSK